MTRGANNITSPTPPMTPPISKSLPNRSLPIPDGSRRCPRCERVLPLSEFAVDRSKANGQKSRCKRCDNAKSKAYYAANRERVLARLSTRNAELREARPWAGQRRRRSKWDRRREYPGGGVVERHGSAVTPPLVPAKKRARFRGDLDSERRRGAHCEYQCAPRREDGGFRDDEMQDVRRTARDSPEAGR
jgi:hypothetical protein